MIIYDSRSVFVCGYFDISVCGFGNVSVPLSLRIELNVGKFNRDSRSDTGDSGRNVISIRVSYGLGIIHDSVRAYG